MNQDKTMRPGYEEGRKNKTGSKGVVKGGGSGNRKVLGKLEIKETAGLVFEWVENTNLSWDDLKNLSI